MAIEEEFWTTTRSGLFRGSDEQWREIAAYGPVIGRYLANRYPRLLEHEREDLVQDLLIEMRERLVPRHDRDRGRFRQLLQVAIRNRVIDRLRRRAGHAPESVGDVPAPTVDEEDVAALDLEASLLGAIADARDGLTQGPDADLDVLYALADRIVRGRTEAEIAADSGVSRDVVARRLRKGRERILSCLLARELDVAPEPPAFALALGVVRDALQRPSERAASLGRLSDPPLRGAVETFLVRFWAARDRFPSLQSPDGAEFRRGLEVLLSC